MRSVSHGSPYTQNQATYNARRDIWGIIFKEKCTFVAEMDADMGTQQIALSTEQSHRRHQFSKCLCHSKQEVCIVVHLRFVDAAPYALGWLLPSKYQPLVYPTVTEGDFQPHIGFPLTFEAFVFSRARNGFRILLWVERLLYSINSERGETTPLLKLC